MMIQARLLHVSVLLFSLCGSTLAGERWGDHLSLHDVDVLWPTFQAAMLDFQKNGDRPAFLKACKDLLDANPTTGYLEPLRGLIEPLEREAAQMPPAFLGVPAEKRTEEENIRYWIFQLRDAGDAQQKLVAIGPSAIPYLLVALDDDMPTRRITWQRSFYPIYFVLRRQDVAMKCLEQITACKFYDEGATYIHLYMDAPERRKSAIDNARAWWRESEGKSQAEGIRNQLRLRQQNITLRQYDRIEALRMLAILEGPEGILDELHELSIRDDFGLNSPIVALLEEFDRPYLVQETLRRFWDNASRAGDFGILLRYGDIKVYREMSKRFKESQTLDTGGWGLGGQGEWAAKYGRHWSIPILADLLMHTKMTGSRHVNNADGSQAFSAADEVVEAFQELTGYDAGYRREASETDRLAAIKNARNWWLAKGRETLKEKIQADHPPVLPIGDLLMSEEDCANLQTTLAGTDAAARRRAIRGLTIVYAPKTQRAVLSALAKEDDPVEHRRILEVLKAAPEPWYLPKLGTVFATNKDVASRVLAGEIILAQFKVDLGRGSPRLETRDQVMQEVRRTTADPSSPPEIRALGTKILADGGYLSGK